MRVAPPPPRAARRPCVMIDTRHDAVTSFATSTPFDEHAAMATGG